MELLGDMLFAYKHEGLLIAGDITTSMKNCHEQKAHMKAIYASF